MELISAVQRPFGDSKSEGKSPDKQSPFKNATINFINLCQSSHNTRYNIKRTSDKLGFRQRRFYDVVNTLETIGCCPKVDSDTFIWLGFDQVRTAIERMAKERGVFTEHFSLEEIFPKDGPISIQRITEEFLMLFIALEQRTINVLEASAFLSRDSDREKTTRCKLYQVAAILEIAGVVKKTDKQSEFSLVMDNFISASERITGKQRDPTSLEYLLNRSTPFLEIEVCPIIKQRRLEYVNLQDNSEISEPQTTPEDY